MGRPLPVLNRISPITLMVLTVPLIDNTDFLAMLAKYLKKQAGEDISDDEKIQQMLKVRRESRPKVAKAIHGVLARTALKFGVNDAVDKLMRADLEWFCKHYPADLDIEKEGDYYYAYIW